MTQTGLIQLYDGSVITKPFDVRRYGAVGDDSTDNATDITAAVTALNVTGGILELPAGTFKTSAVIAPTRSGTIVRGAGRLTTTIKYSGTSGILTPASVRGFTVEHLSLTGDGASGPAVKFTADFGHIRLIDLLITPDSNQHGIDATAGNGIDVYGESVRIAASGTGIGFNFDASGKTAINGVCFVDCYGLGGDLNFSFANCGYTLINCSADSATGTYGYQLGGNGVLIACSCESNATAGYGVIGSGSVLFQKCTAQSQALPWYISDTGARVVLAGCTSSSSPSTYDITIANAASVEVLGDAIADSRISGAYSRLAGDLVLSAAAATVGSGQVSIGATHQTTVGSAGGATALPATPLGYLKINVAGTAAVIPYYPQA